MRFLVALASLGEALTGLALLIFPPLVIRLLFGAEIAGVGSITSRLAGMALIALGMACWPDDRAPRGYFAMLTYSVLATVYLLVLGLQGRWNGKLLWPAIALHAALTLLLAWGWPRAIKATAKMPTYTDAQKPESPKTAANRSTQN